MIRKRMKKPLSIVLMLTLFLSLFGGVMSEGPKSKAIFLVSQIGKINIRKVPYDARDEDYDDLATSTIHEYDSITFKFKRMTGCRIPKGTFFLVFVRNEYNALREEGKYPWQFPTKYMKIRGDKVPLERNYDEYGWYFANGLKAGSYILCLIIPAASNDGKTGFVWKNYSFKVYRYG